MSALKFDQTFLELSKFGSWFLFWLQQRNWWLLEAPGVAVPEVQKAVEREVSQGEGRTIWFTRPVCSECGIEMTDESKSATTGYMMPTRH